MKRPVANYDHVKIEKKWQSRWRKDRLYEVRESEQSKYYILDMFPYPSGEGLHVGHPKGYIATDIYARYKTLKGFNVLHPMGFDAFGLPAENYALKHKVHPKKAVAANVKRYKEQLEILGFNYDWKREVNTTDPEYYRWTQWIFLELFKAGLAYESNEPINWCPSCKTGLANEDVEDGTCERCGTPVEKKPIRQWVLKITDYAEKLLKDIDGLNWPESIKESQRNWIGKSEGVNFKCKIKDLGLSVEMYNSVPQTYHAETFTVIAPEHPLVPVLVKGLPQEKEVLAFVEEIKKRKAGNRFDIEKDMEGIFTGRFIEKFADTGRDLPIWVASYVVADYGTGIVNASAHDLRDFAFAKKYNIPLRPVMFPAQEAEAEKVRNLEYGYAKDPDGVLAEPRLFKGRKWGEVRTDIINHIVGKGLGERKTNYKLRDWVFSRQRYWGEPIPLIHCASCGVVPVPERDLPVKLPNVKSYEPSGTGESPLSTISKWVNVRCPKCGGKGKRETNTMPQWAGSSWYYLRYMDAKNKKVLVDPKKERYWAPVDLYVGGAEHATRHLIYARFWHKFLYEKGYVSTAEPFTRLQHVGLIYGSDGRKMSKRYGNVVNPDDVIKLYGADTLRVYEMFMGPFDQTISWSTENMIGSRRFLERVWRLRLKVSSGPGEVRMASEQIMHQTIKKVGEDIEMLRFNTAISSLMVLVNALEKEDTISRQAFENLLLLLAPFAPHICEELWQEIRKRPSICTASWPTYDSAKLESNRIRLMIQVNGKVRGEIEIGREEDQATIEKMALSQPEIRRWTEGKKPQRIIHVKGKLLSIVM